MLIANSVILYAVNSTALQTEPRVKAALDVIGLLLCVLWAALTWEGWHISRTSECPLGSDRYLNGEAPK